MRAACLVRVLLAFGDGPLLVSASYLAPTWYKYRFTALRPFAFQSACTRPQPRGRLDVENHTSSSSSSSWPDTDRAPSFRRGYHRKTHAALKYCGAADVLSLLSLPPYSSTRLPIGITSFFPDPMHTHSRSRHRDFYFVSGFNVTYAAFPPTVR